MWREMADVFRNVPGPDSLNQLARSLECMFEALTAFPLATVGSVHVKRYEHGGMSSGQVSPEFWREEAIPLLLRRNGSDQARTPDDTSIPEENDDACTTGTNRAIFEARPNQPLQGPNHQEVLKAIVDSLQDLRTKGVLRTHNNPIADYTEWLVCSRLGLTREPSSTKGFDARGPDGTPFEIKARRLAVSQSPIQLSAIRNLRGRHFDYLIAVIYNSDFSIRHAVKIRHAWIEPHSRYSEHTNSHILCLTPALIESPDVEDIKSRLTERSGT